MVFVYRGFFITFILCLSLFSQAASAANSLPSLPKNATAMAPAIQKSANESFDLFFRSMTTFTGLNSSESAGVQIVGLLSLLGQSQANSSQTAILLPGLSTNNSSSNNITLAPSVQVALPNVTELLSQLRIFIVLSIVLCYIFAAGKIAEYLKLSDKPITKRDALAAPFAYVFAGVAIVFLYYLSGRWVPPQNTVITMAVYILFIPLAMIIFSGAAVLYAFFKNRLGIAQSLDMSMKIVLAPLFDGLKGYWTALGAAAALAAISGFSFYSSGGNLSLVTLDFFLLSTVVAIYFAYRSITSRDSESKATNFVTAICIIAPGILQAFFKDLFCAIFRMVPIAFFKTCPLDQLDSGATLGVSITVTMLLLVPIVPFIYAGTVNAIRACVLIDVLMDKKKGKPKANPQEDSQGDGEQTD